MLDKKPIDPSINNGTQYCTLEDVEKEKRNLEYFIRTELTAHVGNLEGQWLTIVDATFQDKEQRKAMKDIVRKMIWDWDTNIVDSFYPNRVTGGIDSKGHPTF